MNRAERRSKKKPEKECKTTTTQHHHYTHHITKRKIPFIFNPKRVVNLCLTVFISNKFVNHFLRLSFLFIAAKKKKKKTHGDALFIPAMCSAKCEVHLKEFFFFCFKKCWNIENIQVTFLCRVVMTNEFFLCENALFDQ